MREASWQTKRLRYLASLNPSKSEIADVDRATEVSFIPMEAVSENGGLDLTQNRPIAEVESGYTFLREGDVAYAKITPCFENGKAAVMVGLTEGIAFGTTELTVLRAKPGIAHGRFLFWLIKSPEFSFAGEATMTGAGGQKRVPDAFTRNFEIACPPLPEQQAIADFLDRETEKIDALVGEQRRLIALLKEKRQAVTSHAVTKGLDPTASLKPSGLDWLGDIPAHWEVTSLRRLVDPKRRITYGIVQPGSPDPNGRYMIRGQDYSKGWVHEDEVFRVSPAIEEPYRRARLATGDIVVTIVGAGTGNTALVPEGFNGANITQTTARIAPLQGYISSDFLLATLASEVGQQQVRLFQKGAAQPGLNLEHLAAFRFPVPPLAEQHEISRITSAKTDGFDALTAEATRAITLLQERRAALISAAVTRKIDVRDALSDDEEAA